jgi:hypothetical protein
MAQQVSTGAMLQCSFGISPSTLNVLPQNRVTANQMAAATIMDHVPMVNVMPFGMCNSIANPVVAAATAAKLGVFTPAACIPATVTPWTPGSATVMIGNLPALTNSCQLTCMWGGIITITDPGQKTVNTA